MIEIFHKNAGLLVRELISASLVVVASDTNLDIYFTLNVSQATFLRTNNG